MTGFTPCLPLFLPPVSALDHSQFGYPLAKVCAWCGRDLPITAFVDFPGRVSHGICQTCQQTTERP